jgi:hypothetical protein
MKENMENYNMHKLKDVIDFLKLNGFVRLEEDSYGNDFCSVILEDDHYAICDNEGNVWYSHDHTIYTLIGYLTYYGYMDKNYKDLR